jgi:pyruvate dehydrogenase (quinone)
MIKVAEVLVDVLHQAGVQRCYGIVGDTLNLFAEHLDRSPIEWVHVRHEEAGAFAAAAEASLTKQLTACAGSCGPGSLHFINGLYEANRNGAPLVVVASQVMMNELGFEFVQEVDFKTVFKECSVYCEMILTPEQARKKMVMACQAAVAKRGVAVVIVPVDVAQSDVPHDAPYPIHTPQPVVIPNPAELDRMANLLNKGKRVTIYAGAGCEGAANEILEIAERLKSPVAHTSRAKNAMEHDNPYNVGLTGILGNEAGYHAILECDTLLMLGANFAWKQFYPAHANIIQVDIDATHLGRRHPVTCGVVGDVKHTLQALLPKLNAKADDAFLDNYRTRFEDAMESWKSHLHPGPHDSIPGSYLTWMISQLADSDSLVSADDGTPIVWALRFFATNGARKVFGSLLHGTMATALPSAIGLKKAAPDRQVIAMCGDGGISMLLGELLTVVQEKLDIKIVVFDNSKLGFVEMEQKSEGMLETFTHLTNPDFGRLADAIGMVGHTVTKAADLEEAISAWLNTPGPALLNVRVNPVELVKPPFLEAKPVMGLALYSARAVLAGRGADVLEMIQTNR